MILNSGLVIHMAEDAEKKESIVYIQTSGVEVPERLYTPFSLAETAIRMGHDAIIYFIVNGVTVVKKGEAEKISLGYQPSIREAIDKALKSGVRLLACEDSCRIMGIGRRDLVKGVIALGPATLNDLILDADAVVTF